MLPTKARGLYYNKITRSPVWDTPHGQFPLALLSSDQILKTLKNVIAQHLNQADHKGVHNMRLHIVRVHPPAPSLQTEFRIRLIIKLNWIHRIHS